VGDDDQSIYGWRGAKIENIRRFQQDYPQAELLRLEQNYRSTGVILKAANAVIANNSDRMGKNLWTEGTDGEPIKLYAAFNDLDEAQFVARSIEQQIGRGYARREIAILYRSNAQSRLLEEALLRAGLPYRIYGGQRFFERAEIKNAVAYLRLLGIRNDDIAFERVVNLPVRGIGDKTLETLRELVRAEGLSMWSAAETVIKQKLLPAGAIAKLAAFLHLIETLDAGTREAPLHELVDAVIKQSGLWQHHEKEKGEKGQARLENLQELVVAAREFDWDEDDAPSPLAAFLDHAALESGEQQAGEFEDAVQMMTLHSAKGLEFPLVFMVGMEEGLFPHEMALQENNLEEERRLRRNPPPLRQRVLQDPLALYPRNPCRAGAGSPGKNPAGVQHAQPLPQQHSVGRRPSADHPRRQRKRRRRPAPRPARQPSQVRQGHHSQFRG